MSREFSGNILTKLLAFFRDENRTNIGEIWTRWFSNIQRFYMKLFK